MLLAEVLRDRLGRLVEDGGPVDVRDFPQQVVP